MKRAQQVKGNNIRKPRKKKKRLSSLTFFLLLTIIFAVTAGLSYIYFKPILVFDSPPIKKGVEKKARKPAEDTEMHTHRLYKPEIWYDTGLERAGTIVVIEDVIRDYMKPHGVSLLDLYIDREGIVYIDVSDEIRKNFKGDAYEEYSLIAGLYSSIKKSAGNIPAIKLLIEGKEAESIGGHIDISMPIGGDFAISQ